MNLKRFPIKSVPIGFAGNRSPGVKSLSFAGVHSGRSAANSFSQEKRNVPVRMTRESRTNLMRINTEFYLGPVERLGVKGQRCDADSGITFPRLRFPENGGSRVLNGETLLPKV